MLAKEKSGLNFFTSFLPPQTQVRRSQFSIFNYQFVKVKSLCPTPPFRCAPHRRIGVGHNDSIVYALCPNACLGQIV